MEDRYLSVHSLFLQNPKWNPSRLEDVDIVEIKSLFEPLLAENELNV